MKNISNTLFQPLLPLSIIMQQLRLIQKVEHTQIGAIKLLHLNVNMENFHFNPTTRNVQSPVSINHMPLF